ncbi:MAG: DUF1127 domain-containing protein [Cognatishimia sp.]|jgi:uncharacterized protein YjiS (DUF1127 family)|uniref:DUF1127 domain-containing protein n=1 Tax=Cognatishimia sp. TaxID=2211648 RepID=UPI004057F861
MSRTSTLQLSQLTQTAATQPLPLFAQWAIAFAATVTLWERRAKTRKALADLDQARLQDVGISPEEARDEIRKRYWNA